MLDGNNIHGLMEMPVTEVARGFETPEQMAEFLTTVVNGQYTRGRARKVGHVLHEAHPSLQAEVLSFCFGIIEGLAAVENNYLDDRNRDAIVAARAIAAQVQRFAA